MKKAVRLYVNSTKEKAHNLSKQIEKELLIQGYEISDQNTDIVIGFGGDGTLLNFLRECSYEAHAKYIGINCGTLGFMQDFEVDDVHSFVLNIPNYVERRLNFILLTVYGNGKQISFNALNEFNIQNSNDKAFRAQVTVEDELLENYFGTGIILSTPTGSTAHNLSSVGSIVYPGIDVIQLTPREAIVNSRTHCLAKSICIPKKAVVGISPNSDDEIKIFSDGVVVYTGTYEDIEICYSDLYMVKLTDTKNSFTKKIREKLI